MECDVILVVRQKLRCRIPGIHLCWKPGHFCMKRGEVLPLWEWIVFFSFGLFLALQAFDRAGPLAVGRGIFRLALEYPIPLSRRGGTGFLAL